jgi:hypothetical protein
MAAASHATSAFTAFLKNRYPQRKLEALLNFGTPFLNSLKKSDSLAPGSQITYVPMETDLPQGLSAGTSTTGLRNAITGETSTQGLAWQITRAKGYAAHSIDGETLLGMKRDENAFFRAQEHEIDRLLKQMGLEFEQALFQDGSGKIGSISSDPGTGTTFTLVNASDAINFHVGMQILFYPNSSGALGTVRSGGTRTVSLVNYDTGVITVSAAIDADVLSSGSLDWVVRSGNNDLLFKGLPAWIPSADPTSSLFGITRSNYSPQVIGGHRQSYLGSIEETVKKLESKMRRLSSEPRQLWMSYANFNRLETELGAKAYRMEDGGEKVFGASALRMSTPGGGIVVRCSPFAPDTGAWLLDMSTWELKTLGAMPHVIDDDGQMARMIGSTSSDAEDAIRILYRWIAQLVCVNPFANGYMAIT